MMKAGGIHFADRRYDRDKILENLVRNIFEDGHLEEETTVGIFFIRNVEAVTTEMLARFFLS
jgi:hypothetical protein